MAFRAVRIAVLRRVSPTIHSDHAAHPGKCHAKADPRAESVRIINRVTNIPVEDGFDNFYVFVEY